MVKKGEYIDYGVSLYENMKDFDPITMGPNDIYYSTEVSIILELTNKIKELEARIIELEKGS